MSDALLPIIWYCIICGELALYLLLDGANLGVGLISLFPQKEKERSHMLNVLGPIWNANETWLLVAAGTMFGAFPLVYSVGLNALYVPGVIILIGLIGRAVSFEFHVYGNNKGLWTRLFGVSSAIVVIGQGCLFGGLLSGISVVDGHFGGTLWDWATPLTALIAIGISFGYLVLGYSFLIRQMEYHNVHETFDRILSTAGATGLALAGATFLLPNINYLFFSRWTTPPTMYLLFVDAACIALLVFALLYNVWHKRHHERIYYYCLGIFALGALGLLIGTYPYLLPPTVTIYDAASPANTLRFMLWGIGPLLPIILAYNYYIAHIFERPGSRHSHDEY